MRFLFERETKRTVRYHEDSTKPKIGILYVQKWYLEQEFGKYPEALEVEIKEANKD